tara:strand:+ start:13 stop:288 length:276 start_codon:yes stop_codon:yes gene_type:complete
MYKVNDETISLLEDILNEELSENSITIQDAFFSNGNNWLGDKPRCNYILAIFEIVYNENLRDVFHLGSVVFVSSGLDWRLQHYQIDVKMGI